MKILKKGEKTGTHYTPRVGGIIKSMEQFSDDHISFIIKENAPYLKFFDYGKYLSDLTEE